MCPSFRFSCVSTVIPSGAGAILVYDRTDTSTFSRVQKWVKELRRMVGDHNTICLIIVGNKSDLSRLRAVDEEEASAYAKSVDANFMEVSAKTGHGVEDIFLKLTVGELVLSIC